MIFSPIFLGQSRGPGIAIAATGKTKKVLLIASEKVVQVAPDDPLHPGGIKYNAMVFNGTVPGPVISLTQGDNVQITLRNDGKVIHSLDFHMGYGANEANSGQVQAGQSKTWIIHNPAPGAWFYLTQRRAHSGTCQEPLLMSVVWWLITKVHPSGRNTS